MADESSRNVVEMLAEEFVERYRTGERPPLKDYVEQYPEHAEEIKDLFPALLVMENLKLDEDHVQSSRVNHSPLKQIGEYRILREAGRGGMGVVYEAEQLSLGRRVALKVLPQHILHDEDHQQRFEREAKAAAKLHHTNIVPVFGVGEQDGLHYYVMQFIQGLGLDEIIDQLRQMSGDSHTGKNEEDSPGTPGFHEFSVTNVARSLVSGQFTPRRQLASERDSPVPKDPFDLHCSASHYSIHPERNEPSIAVDGPSPSSGVGGQRAPKVSGSLLFGSNIDEPPNLGSDAKSGRKQDFWTSVANIGRQVASALQYAHEQGVTHRDIKPSNLLLDMQGTVWITDFGLAKSSEHEDITRTGDLLGTLRYMPPETFDGRSDPLGDQYSLGLTLYELIGRQPAFNERDRNRLIKLVTHGAPLRIEKINSEVPSDLATIIHRSIERNPSHRYDSAGAMAADLERFLADEPIRARRVPLSERIARWSRHNRALALSLSVVGVLLLLINVVGPLLLFRMSQLNNTLQIEQGRLTSSKASLLATVRKLEHREQELKIANTEARRAISIAHLGEELEAAARKEADRQRTLARRAMYSSALFAAQKAISTPEGYRKALELLDGVRPQLDEADMRGWEWYYLHSLHTSHRLILQSFSKYPVSVKFSPDGKLLATSETSGLVKIFDATSGKLMRTLTGHVGVVSTVRWNPEGTQLATAGADWTARIWNIATGKEESRIDGHSQWVTAVAWSPDGQRVLTGSLDRTVRIWEAKSGRQLIEIQNPHEIRGVDWSPDGQHVAAGRDDGKVCIWNAESGRIIHEMDGHRSRVGRVRFSPDSRRIASSSWETTNTSVIIWDAIEGTKLRILECFSGIHDVAWSPEGDRLVTAGWNSGRVEIWNVDSGSRIEKFDGHLEGVYECSWSPDARRIASASADGTLIVWGVVAKNRSTDFSGRSETIRTLQWSRDGTQIATGGDETAVTIWDVRLRKKLVTFDHHQAVECLSWNPSGSRIVSCGQETVFHIWDTQDGQILNSINATKVGQVNSVAWSPRDTKVVSGADDKTVRVFDTAIGEEAQQFQMTDAVRSVTWTSDGNFIAAGDDSGDLRIWNTTTEELAAHFSIPGQQLLTLAFHPDSKILAVGGRQRQSDSGERENKATNTISIWDLETNQLIRRLPGHENAVSSLEWSKDGSRLLSSGFDGNVVLWDTATGSRLLSIPSLLNRPVLTARLSPDQLKVASAGRGLGLRVWDTASSHAAELSPELLPVLNERIRRESEFEDLVLRGRILSSQGDWSNAEADFRRAVQNGNVMDKEVSWIESAWWVAGPSPLPINDMLPPVNSVDINKSMSFDSESGTKHFNWIRTHFSQRHGLDLEQIFAGAEQISTYAMTRYYCFGEENVGLLIRADDPCRVWWNDDPVRSFGRGGPSHEYENAIAVKLHSGWNTLVVELINNSRPLGLFARLSNDPRDLARVFERDRQWERSLNYWEQARQVHHDFNTLFSHGRAALKSGRQDLAAESFQLAIDQLEDKSSGYRTLAQLYYEDAQFWGSGTDSKQATDSLSKARDLYERLVQSESVSGQDISALAEVELAMNEPGWIIPTPTELNSQSGEMLNLQDDRSIFVTGPIPHRAIYELKFKLDQPISFIRLETIPDPRLPHGSAGRHPGKGNFHVSEISAHVESGGESGHSRLIPITAAVENRHLHWPATVHSAIDGRETTRWDPDYRTPRSAVFSLQSTVPAETRQLVVTIDSGITQWGYHGLGRFRLSFTNDPKALEILQQQFAVTNIEDPWVKICAAYTVVGDYQQAANWLARVPDFKTRQDFVELMVELQIDLRPLGVLRPDDPLFAFALSKQQSVNNQHKQSAESLKKSKRLMRLLIEKFPNDESVARFYAEISKSWVVLKPVDVTSKGEETFEILEDNSIFVSGPNPHHAIYTISFRLDAQAISSIRIETIPDPRLPQGGAGRYPENGNFHLAELRAAISSKESASEQEMIAFSTTSEDVKASARYSADSAIDGELNTRWDTDPHYKNSHWAIFNLKSPVQQEGGILSVTLDSGLSPWGQHGLGRFRISALKTRRSN